MIAYASRTGTKRNLDALRIAGWRLMVSAKGVLRTEGFPYALDNGAWWAFQQGLPFDEAAFMVAWSMLAAGADFAVLPDIVAGGARSLAYSLNWRARLGAPPCRLMIAVQDGMTPGDVRPHVGPACGIFVGGSTDWKLQTMAQWGELARDVEAQLHIARVNTARRIALCHAAGADSFDGSGPARYAVILQRLDNAVRQRDLLA